MIREFRLPDLGEGLTESEILTWHVAVGDLVALNQVIADVETAKAVVELPSPYAGTVVALHEEPGRTVEVGAPIVSFDVAAPAGLPVPAAGPPAAAGPAGPAGPAAREPNLVGYGAQPDRPGRPTRRPRFGGSGPAKPGDILPPRPAPAPEDRPAGRPRSTPPVRKLARDLGVDLAAVAGSGRDGLVLRADVVQAAGAQAVPEPQAVWEEQPAGPQPVPPHNRHAAAGSVADREERIPIASLRRKTAAAMVASAFTAPTATVFLTVDVTASMDLLDRLRNQPVFAGLRLSPLTLAAKAVCLGVRRFPALNSRWDETAQEIVRYNYVNLGIAAATPRGLIVPTIKDAQDLGIRDLAAQLTALSETARAGKTQPADLFGGTVSISNVGVFGVDAGTPILNPGESALLALGAVRRQPWEYQGTMALRSVMTLSLSFDHRVADGAEGAGFLSAVGAVLEEPALLLAMA